MTDKMQCCNKESEKSMSKAELHLNASDIYNVVKVYKMTKLNKKLTEEIGI